MEKSYILHVRFWYLTVESGLSEEESLFKINLPLIENSLPLLENKGSLLSITRKPSTTRPSANICKQKQNTLSLLAGDNIDRDK